MTHSVSQHLQIPIDEYDRIIRTFIGGYDQMLDEAVRQIGSVGALDRVLDLGAGTGALSERLLAQIPRARVELWDVDSAMLDQARRRLAPFGDRAQFIEGSFFDELPRADAIIASLSLHHVRDLGQKTELYRSIAGALRPGGAFVNCDITIPAEPSAGRQTYRRWADQLVSGGIEAEQAWRHFDQWSDEDRYFSLEEELGAITKAGLTPECPWHFNPATITVGRKP